MRKATTKTYGRAATQQEVRKYKGKRLPIEQLPIFCSPVLYEPLYTHYRKTAGIHFRYRHNGLECVLRAFSDDRSEALFEFVHGGDMVWLTPEEVFVKPGDEKVTKSWNATNYMEGPMSWL